MCSLTRMTLVLLLTAGAHLASAEPSVSAAAPGISLASGGRISLYIEGELIEGSQERWAKVQALPEDKRWAALKDKPRTLVSTDVFQMKVTATDAAGRVVDHTGTKRLRYQGFGCLATSADGNATALGLDVCETDQPSEIWIWLYSEDGARPTTINQYRFNVAPQAVAK